MSGRVAYLVTYDIADPKRLRRVYQTMRSYGEHLQLSVFRCELAAAEHVELVSELEQLINHDEDQVLLVNLGPPTGKRAASFDAIGRTLQRRERVALVL